MKLDEKFPTEYLNLLTHFYRGEVNRETVWRQRMDTTTNWAILATTATFSWAFTAERTESHFIFPFATLLVFLLLYVEARRYRQYDVARTRVRMLEVHLMVPALNPEVNILQGDWRTVLSNDLLLPTFKISTLEAVGLRLYRNYAWLFLILFTGWILRVYSGADDDKNGWVELAELYRSCGYRFLPPGFTIFIEALLNVGVVAILGATWKSKSVSGEIRRRDPNAKKWPI